MDEKDEKQLWIILQGLGVVGNLQLSEMLLEDLCYFLPVFFVLLSGCWTNKSELHLYVLSQQCSHICFTTGVDVLQENFCLPFISPFFLPLGLHLQQEARL